MDTAKTHCTFSGCHRKVRAVGLCASHYEQQRNNQELRPIKVYTRFAQPAPGKKICNECRRVLDEDTDFYKRTNGRPTAYCRECCDERVRVLKRKRRREANEQRG